MSARLPEVGAAVFIDTKDAFSTLGYWEGATHEAAMVRVAGETVRVPWDHPHLWVSDPATGRAFAWRESEGLPVGALPERE